MFDNTAVKVGLFFFFIFFLKVNEPESAITFGWMAKAKLTEQYADCYITGMQQTDIAAACSWTCSTENILPPVFAL